MRGNTLRSSRPANSMEQDSFDSFDDAEDMLVMSTGNMRLGGTGRGTAGTNAGTAGTAGDSLNASGAEDEELPKSVVVTNVDLSVFDNEGMKSNFETMFREYDNLSQFHYLRSFRRIRIDFDSHLTAAKAKVSMDGAPVGEKIIHCYFIQVLSPCTDEDAFLHVPPMEKQFLISPPSSPPVGWEQPKEDRPVVDYDLLAAMAQLGPGDKHELHESRMINVLGKSVSTPSIVVHVADGDADAGGGGIAGMTIASAGRKIRHTKCPDRQSSLD